MLGIPDAVEPVAWLCVGWPDERPLRPGLERAGWARRRPLADVVHRRALAVRRDAPPTGAPVPDAAARIAARDRADLLVKPAGSLGALEDVVERWSAATGAPPPAPLRAAHLLFAADHGHAARGTSLFDGAVSGQVAAAAARGETAIGVLARAREETLVVADVGLRGPTPPGCVDRRCAAGDRRLRRRRGDDAGAARRRAGRRGRAGPRTARRERRATAWSWARSASATRRPPPPCCAR